MQIEEIDIKQLIPYERNPRNNKDAIDKVAESIRAFGFKVPIVIDGNNVIVAGHTRWLAAKRLNFKTVPCIKADDLTPEQVQAFRLADNRVAEFSKWDKKLLKQELKALSELNFDMSAFGFGNDDIREVVEDDYIEEIPEEPKTKRGDIYQLGIHRVVCGDSTNADDMALLMGGEQADLILTDPPYNVNYEGGALKKRHKIVNDNLSSEDFTVFLSEAFRNGYAGLKDGGSLYSFCATKSWDSFRRSLEGDVVLDIFGGSGSTLITCEQMKRKSLTIEIDPAFVDVIIDRWERFTGRKAEKL